MCQKTQRLGSLIFRQTKGNSYFSRKKIGGFWRIVSTPTTSGKWNPSIWDDEKMGGRSGRRIKQTLSLSDFLRNMLKSNQWMKSFSSQAALSIIAYSQHNCSFLKPHFWWKKVRSDTMTSKTVWDHVCVSGQKQEKLEQIQLDGTHLTDLL